MIAICIYCGFKIEHGTRRGATRDDAHQALIDHDRQCPKNPVAQERDSLAAHQTDLVRELTSCQAVLHSLAHSGEVTPQYADDAKAVLGRTKEASLARREARAAASALRDLGTDLHIEAHEEGDDDKSAGYQESGDLSFERARRLMAQGGDQ